MREFRLIFFILALGCAAGSTGFKEPGSNGNTLIVLGSLAVDLFEYEGMTRTYRDGVDAIIASKRVTGGKEVYRNYWVKTDDRGYFTLSNVPDGEYSLRGFRIQTFGGPYYLTAVSRLEGPDQFNIHNKGAVPESGSQFDFIKQNRIVNLRHNYFIVDRGESVHHRVFHRFDDLETASGTRIREPDVLDYFKSKHKDSGWFKQ